MKSVTFKNITQFGQYEYPSFDGDARDPGIFIECDALKSADLTGLSIIPEGLFYKCKKLEEVSFGNQVVRIEMTAFYGCGFTEFTVPDTVVSIGDLAFGKNLKLKKFTIGKGIYKLSERWFSTPKQLTVVIPPNVKDINPSAFEGIDSVKIEFSSDNQIYSATDNSIISKIGNTLVGTVGLLGKVYELHEIVRSISEGAIIRRRPYGSTAVWKEMKDGIAEAAIIKMPSNLIAIKDQPSLYVQSACYEGEYSISSGFSPLESFTTEKYLYETFLGNTASNQKCSTSLSDGYKWRHIIGMSSAEIGLTAAIVVLGVLLIVVIILYFVCPRDKLSSAADDAV